MNGHQGTGFFISFEGSEGCGKSTQIRTLAAALERAGLAPLVVREPGGTPAGEVIRNLLKHAPEGRDLTPEAELLLFAASRAQLARRVIAPALADGRVVIADRFLDSTTVYQGVARNIPAENVDAVNSFAAGARLPDVTFLLDLDPAEGLRRALVGRNAPPDRMESEALEFYQAVRAGYLALARREPARFRLLDASLPAEEIAARILTTLHNSGHAAFERIRA